MSDRTGGAELHIVGELSACRDALAAAVARAETLERERDEVKAAAESALESGKIAVKAGRTALEDAKSLRARAERAEQALRDTERDARWIVGQWQRLQDEPLKEVALAIVERAREVLGVVEHEAES